MRRHLFLLLVICFLGVTTWLAVDRPPQSFYPSLVIEYQDGQARTNLTFVLDPRRTLAECEFLTGNLSRTALAQCERCSVTRITCNSMLDAEQARLLGNEPIEFVSGRMSNGAIRFDALTPTLALAACQRGQAESTGKSNPVKCYPPNTERDILPHTSLPSPWSLVVLLIAFSTSWLIGWFIIRYEHLHAHFSHDFSDGGPQKYHTQPTPRIGGLQIMGGLAAATGAIILVSESPATQRGFELLLYASLPAFLGGLLEDVTKRIEVRERLALTMCSGSFGALLLGAVLKSVGIPILDPLFVWLPFAVLFTAFAIGGLANSINIIDGYNGLASGFSIIVLVVLAIVANCVNDALVFNSAVALAGAIAGFFIWNWPAGKIFLGDGGAYLVGFLLAELSVLLVVRNPSVSPWVPLTPMIHPIVETLYSIYRRKIVHRLSPGLPDNLHLHQLIHDKLLCSESEDRHINRNSQVAKYIWAVTGLLALVTIAFWRTPSVLIGSAVCFCVLYILVYRNLKFRGEAIGRPRLGN